MKTCQSCGVLLGDTIESTVCFWCDDAPELAASDDLWSWAYGDEDETDERLHVGRDGGEW